ncbi:VOC family protein [Rudaeicoccus suwonensis]|uniref:Glyoxalase/bleomycin resistance protein/dioxygenase superfamily protein n=1 Tax=Rudaeicoccus suwonensis TaxID=657409 RepID=A0A561E8I7_9MICO|nr:VOC family protein [Rudaeicoccus suwonensis]TWE11929.1 glyoxalase/bleomycin resistance protein/dioxygenase superfamily protein [Rudaeicoccus suwonensis]
MAGFHHVEIWVADFSAVRTEWDWLLTEVGFAVQDEWENGASWIAGGAYLVVTASPSLSQPDHDRRRPGVNHVAFKADSAAQLDQLMHDAPLHGWEPLYQERYPHAGGVEHYAGWLENSTGFKVEMVADGP